MSGRSSLVARLFWTTVIGGAFAFWFGLPALAATGLCLCLILLRRLDRPRRFRSSVRRLARAHAGTLALRRRQECFEDAYGNRIDDGWLRERDYFAERTILPHLDAKGFTDLADTRWATVLDIIDEVALSVDLPDEDEAPEDGIAYERFCAEALREAGWSARPTKASGDQGADVVAERAGTRLVLQCKRYTKPVGNAAVQEVAAAARYWQADMAAVVSNAGFTPAARRLSGATGVLLLHHDALRQLSPVRKSKRLNTAPA
ncbi:restriction endonuclease [Methylobacterium sp. 77]|uniref:restriction endonuclease n=1 Tax=Methylobacterium sp. 77 TaxID=1101192 RepID=UPI0003828C2A|nr:restriction endonuclease [Methylobacterium sp. 77]